MRTETFARWMGIGAPLFAGIALSGALILHLGLRLNWSTLAIPFASFAAFQVAFFAAIFWAQKHKYMRMAALIVGIYLAGSGSMLIHYSSRWGLQTGLGEGDLWGFNASIAAVTIGLVLMPRRWRERLSAEGVECTRCHHYHEGHDCTCGCRVDQFKYPMFGI
jgi:hypothetical protein